VWLFDSVVNLFSAKVFHNLIDLSAPDETIYLLSAEKATVKTSFECPKNYLVVLPDLKSHNLKVLSHDDEITKLLSYDKDKSLTK
jgi:hypothetical protein